MNFCYYSPTKIFFGKDEETKIGSIIRDYGFKKILLHYGKSSIKQNGLYSRIIKSLNDAQIDYIELSSVEANPKIDLVRKGVELCKKEKVDFILAVGGGSVIDSAKAIAVSVIVDFDPWLFSIHRAIPTSSLPIGVILTISVAGSELSNSCVISDPVSKIKNGFNSDLIRPLFAIENPELTYSVSSFQTGCGIVDILMHTLERYLTDVELHPLASQFAEGIMKEVLRAGKIAISDPCNYEARSTLMLASSFSHNGLTGMGGKMYFTVHKLEHQLSGKYDQVAHGAGLAVLFPAWAMYVWPHLKNQFASFAYHVMEISKEVPFEEAIVQAIFNLKQYFHEIGMPTKLSELGLDFIDIEKIASDITDNGKLVVNGCPNLTKQDVQKIFNNCL